MRIRRDARIRASRASTVRAWRAARGGSSRGLDVLHIGSQADALGLCGLDAATQVGVTPDQAGNGRVIGVWIESLRHYRAPERYAKVARVMYWATAARVQVLDPSIPGPGRLGALRWPGAGQKSCGDCAMIPHIRQFFACSRGFTPFDPDQKRGSKVERARFSQEQQASHGVYVPSSTQTAARCQDGATRKSIGYALDAASR
jgi:hypothetical protein